MLMQKTTLPLDDLLLLEPRVFNDSRGFFFESFSDATFKQLTGQSWTFVQDNHSMSAKGVLRGIHYQKNPAAQGKLVRVIAGEIWDVAVDLRKNSATCGQHVGVTLSSSNKQQLWIPPGFGHGFVAKTEGTEVCYKTTCVYAPESEETIVWNDPDLNIAWSVDRPLVSEKDQQGIPFKQATLF